MKAVGELLEQRTYVAQGQFVSSVSADRVLHGQNVLINLTLCYVRCLRSSPIAIVKTFVSFIPPFHEKSDTLLGVAKHVFRNKTASKFFEIISDIETAASFRLRRMILCRKLCSLCHSELHTLRKMHSKFKLWCTI